MALHNNKRLLLIGLLALTATGCQKADAMWNDKIVPSRYAQLPPLASPGVFDLLKLTSSDFSVKTLTTKGDEFEPGRRKLIHAFGAEARLRLVMLLGAMTRQPQPHGAGQRPLLTAVQRWNRWITNPALGLVWLLDLTLAWQGGWFSAQWFSAHWLWAKLVLVTVWSALHGNQTATLRRMAANPAHTPPAYKPWSAGLTVAAITAIVLLVILKPAGG